MPELPEAERARLALEKHALGRVVADADDSDTYVCRPWPPGAIREALVGHRVTGADRVGKQLLIETDGPVLGIHLGMSGSLWFDDHPDLRFKRFEITFTDGGRLLLNDPRRLGRVTLDPARSHWGPDALQVSLPRFQDLVGRSRAPVKARLLNQQALAGVGNLLADEALWRAGIDPRRRGVDLDGEELARLRRAVRAAIRGAIKAGGTGRSAFARSRGLGICPRDGAELATARVGGRTTRWCPVDQPPRPADPQLRPRRSGSSTGAQVRPTRNGPKRP
jgi:formamidopyrimidine-DNA glycosylase